MNNQHTLETMLIELASQPTSEVAVKLCRKLKLGIQGKKPARLNVNQCVVILALGRGEICTYSDYRNIITKLVNNGYIAKELSETRGSNHRPLNRYWLTDKGQAAHQEIVAKFTPVLDRINKQLLQAK